jgi:hypothetical protein
MYLGSISIEGNCPKVKGQFLVVIGLGFEAFCPTLAK